MKTKKSTGQQGMLRKNTAFYNFYHNAKLQTKCQTISKTGLKYFSRTGQELVFATGFLKHCNTLFLNVKNWAFWAMYCSCLVRLKVAPIRTMKVERPL